MANKQKKTTKKASSKFFSKFSVIKLLVAGSVTLNIAALVIFVTMAASNGMDWMFVNQGVQRYCLSDNDYLFESSSEQVRAMRDYTCARGDAADYFQDGFKAYLRSENIDY